MSLPLKKNFGDYDNFLTEPNYTTSAEAQDYFRNMDMLVEALIDVGLWQPETNYPNGHVVFSPNMPNGTEAVCVATNGGKSSNTEPSWGEVGGDNVSDGTCFWKLRWKHWSKSVEEIADLTTGATNRLPNKAYAAGNVVYTDSNLSVALKCTTAGTTSNTELDISGVSVGSSVEDGTCVWQVVSRDTVATIEKERPIKTFTSLEQLGLPNTCTPEDIANAMPLHSMLTCGIACYGDNPTNPNLGLEDDGILTVKTAEGRGFVEFYFNTNNKSYRGIYSNWANPNFSGWEKLATNGALSMPSDQYISIAFNFTDHNTAWQSIGYIAPCDGWATIYCGSGENSSRSIVMLMNGNIGVTDVQYGTHADRKLFIPVQKGNLVEFRAVNCWFPDTSFFRFYYAQSEV